MPRTTSAAGRAAISNREGCILHAYRDTVGVWTIGVGHTGRMSSPPVTPGMTITPEQADIFLANDLALVEAAIAQCVKVATTQNQHDAMASLAFNIGAHGFVGSTVVHKLNAGDPQGAADAFLMWETPRELAKRRIGERAQFLELDGAPAPESPPPVPDDTADVQALQSHLATLKYYAGVIDGDFGPATLAAVKAFQVAHNLTPDGVVGDKTFGMIDAAIKVASTPPIFSPGKVEIAPVVAGPHNLPVPVAPAKPWWKFW